MTLTNGNGGSSSGIRRGPGRPRGTRNSTHHNWFARHCAALGIDEAQHLADLMRQYGNPSAAAGALGCNYWNIHRALKEHGFRPQHTVKWVPGSEAA